MGKDLSKAYNPKEFEDKWYKFWEDNKLFSPRKGKKEQTYTIVIPPPNVTSVLHMGHGLNNTVQDILIRYKRMCGYETLWIPGTDHAGIATQNVVERELAKQGKKRTDFTREEFLKIVWDTALRHQTIIINQLRKLGCSADWDRVAFTLDEKRSRAVKEVFIRLFKKKLIYKAKYIVNWCPRCSTALADDEVNHSEKESHLWYIKYPIKDSDEYVVVATTRPETMLGDTAVAFNNNDTRYLGLKGKKIILPLVNREIPVIFDSYVDPDFGTGAVKVTPAHDPNDFEMAKRHNLEFINIFNEDATTNENVPERYRKLDRYECRKLVLKDLEEEGFLVKTEKYKHSVGECYRCKTVIEPRYSDQWFVNMKALAKPAIDVVKKGRIKFIPKRWEKVYFNWLENIKDWCISRQLWWGHRIPVYYCKKCNNMQVDYDTPKTCEKCGSTEFDQDPDVLDTWFSSWLWPFSTLGWPDETEDLKKFYPTSTLVTGPDIIFFWVARMIMAGLEFLGEIPFSQVFFTGMVMDLQGRKMSKTLGNGIDPFDVIERHGADALRYTMVAIVSPNQNLRLGFPKEKNSKEIDSFEIGAKFANKIWNASRFLLMNLPDDFKQLNIDKIEKDVFDEWIIAKLNETVKKVNNYFEAARFNDAATALNIFFWDNFCDWYIELSKSKIFSENQSLRDSTLSILIYVLKEFLKLLHPIMPFITEEIYQQLPEHGFSIMIEEYPQYNKKYKLKSEVEKKVNKFFSLVHIIRNIRGEMNVSPDKKIEIIVKTTDNDLKFFIKKYEKDILYLTRGKSINVFENIQKPEGSAAGANEYCEIFIPLKDIIDVNKEIERLKKEIEKINKEYLVVTSKLRNESFLQKAPKDVIKKEQIRKKEYEELLEKLNKNLNVLLS